MSIRFFLIIICWTICFLSLKAHSPSLSSTLLVEKENNQWSLQIRSALTAFEYEIHQRFSKDAYTTGEEFQQLLIQHLKENLSLYCNDKEITFTNVFVRLGHETMVVLECVAMPKTINEIVIKNSCFQHIHHNQSALVVLEESMAKKQFVLNKENQHTAKLKKQNQQFVLEILPTKKKEEVAEDNYLNYIYSGIGVVLLAIIVGGLYIKRKNTNLSIEN